MTKNKDRGSLFITREDDGTVTVKVRSPNERHESSINLTACEWQALTAAPAPEDAPLPTQAWQPIESFTPHLALCSTPPTDALELAQDSLDDPRTIAKAVLSAMTTFNNPDRTGLECRKAKRYCAAAAPILARALLARPTAAPDRHRNYWSELKRIYNALPKRPRCRDCADENGICPGDGWPCDPTEEVIARLSRKEPPQ